MTHHRGVLLNIEHSLEWARHSSHFSIFFSLFLEKSDRGNLRHAHYYFRLFHIYFQLSKFIRRKNFKCVFVSLCFSSMSYSVYQTFVCVDYGLTCIDSSAGFQCSFFSCSPPQVIACQLSMISSAFIGMLPRLTLCGFDMNSK